MRDNPCRADYGTVDSRGDHIVAANPGAVDHRSVYVGNVNGRGADFRCGDDAWGLNIGSDHLRGSVGKGNEGVYQVNEV